MKKYDGKIAIWVFLAVLVIGVIVAYDRTYGYSQSQEGTEGVVTFTHSSECDSAQVLFGYPDSTNWYDTVSLFPMGGATDSSYLYTHGLDLDSIGPHIVRVAYWEHDGDNTVDGYVVDLWLHEKAPVLDGLYTVDYVLLNSADSTPIYKASVNFRDWTLANSLRYTTSNASGIARVGLDADSVAVLATSPHWTFPTTWDSITYSSNHTDTLWGASTEPAAAGTVDYVAAYIDVGTGIVDLSGNMIPRTGIELQLQLVGQPYLHLTDHSWVIIPKLSIEYPNPVGRVTFYVPANTAMSPPGSHYVLTYIATDGYTRSVGQIRKFVLDTIPDPVKIIATTRVR